MKYKLIIVSIIFLVGLFIAGSSFPSSQKTEPLKKVMATKESEVFLGKWEGFIEGKGGIKLQIVFEIMKNENNTLRCLCSMPLQGLIGEPVQAFSIEGNTINITIPLVMFTYSGSLKEDHQSIEGVLKRDKGDVKIDLKKVDKISSPLRPQTPKKPYPYNELEVKFPALHDDVVLAGTLTFPKSGEPFAAAILISGAGPRDRNEEGGGHRPFLVLADYLTRRGIAVLRYDDPGFGESTGSQDNKTTSADRAVDVKAAFQFLKTQSSVNSKKIGLIGHSEGGVIAQIVAGDIDEIAYIVLMAGPALPGKDIYLHQLKVASGQSAYVKDTAKSWERIKTILEKEQIDEDRASEEIYSILADEIKMPVMQARYVAEFFLSPWMRYFLKKDPADILSKVKCPVLALGGKKDVAIPSSQNLKAIEEILQKAGNENYKIVEFPNLNHLFQTANTGLPMEFSLIEETMAPVVLKTIADWVMDQVNGTPPDVLLRNPGILPLVSCQEA
jgi:pimeloyl-ACP methyl ester carboxylesterase